MEAAFGTYSISPRREGQLRVSPGCHLKNAICCDNGVADWTAHGDQRRPQAPYRRRPRGDAENHPPVAGSARLQQHRRGRQRRRALEKLREKNYDLILSDWNMDEMSGFELLKHVRADPRTANIPFILVTAEAKPENILAAKAAGANAYLLKPFKLDMLQKTIEDVLSAESAAA